MRNRTGTALLAAALMIATTGGVWAEPAGHHDEGGIRAALLTNRSVQRGAEARCGPVGESREDRERRRGQRPGGGQGVWDPARGRASREDARHDDGHLQGGDGDAPRHSLGRTVQALRPDCLAAKGDHGVRRSRNPGEAEADCASRRGGFTTWPRSCTARCSSSPTMRVPARWRVSTSKVWSFTGRRSIRLSRCWATISERPGRS